MGRGMQHLPYLATGPLRQSQRDSMQPTALALAMLPDLYRLQRIDSELPAPPRSGRHGTSYKGDLCHLRLLQPVTD